MGALGIWIGAGDERRGFFGNDVVNDADDTRVGGVGPDGVRVGDVDFDDAASGARGDRGGEDARIPFLLLHLLLLRVDGGLRVANVFFLFERGRCV